MKRRKLVKEIIVCMLAMVIMSLSTMDSFAASFKQMVVKDTKTIERMSVEELNQYIGYIEKSCKSQKYTNAYDGIQSAWLAAAQIAKKKGYKCAGTMVEYSVKNMPYNESAISGLCEKKIVKTSAYKSFLKKAKGKKSDSGSMELTKQMNADLFYALHNVNIKSQQMGYGKLVTYSINVTDTFDFARDNNYNDLFTTIINNWAWLSQQAGYLHKIRINIAFIQS